MLESGDAHGNVDVSMREVKGEEEKRKGNRTRQKTFLITAARQVNNGKAKGARGTCSALSVAASCSTVPTQIFRYLGQRLGDILKRKKGMIE